MAIGQFIPSVLDLVPGYYKTIYALEKARKATNDEAEKELLGEMIADCQYCIEWMRAGGNPNRRRGVEARYSRPWDPKWIESYKSPHGWEIERSMPSRDLTDDERFRIEEAMRDLTARERQCFMMHHVDGMSLGDIAAELHLSKASVQTNIDRAQAKIEDAKLNSLFLIG
jgi:RNA polymerase sigma-70 factor (ECF subfamily)